MCFTCLVIQSLHIPWRTLIYVVYRIIEHKYKLILTPVVYFISAYEKYTHYSYDIRIEYTMQYNFIF